MREKSTLIMIMMLGLCLTLFGCGYKDSGSAGGDTSVAPPEDNNGGNPVAPPPSNGGNPGITAIYDLGTLGSRTSSVALASDGQGNVVGRSESSIHDVSAVLWQTGPSRNVNSLPLVPLESGGYSIAFSMNSHLIIVGESGLDPGSLPVVWRFDLGQTEPESLETLRGGIFGASYDINEQNMVVGEVDNPATGTSQAALWSFIGNTFKVEILPSLDINKNSAANSINETGQIVGESEDADGMIQAVLWLDLGSGLSDPLELIPLEDSPTGRRSTALAVSDKGHDGELHIVGEFVDADGLSHAVLWTVTDIWLTDPIIRAVVDIVDLGLLAYESKARTITSTGIAGGWVQVTDGSDRVGVTWDIKLENFSNFRIVEIPEASQAQPTASEIFSLSLNGLAVGKFQTHTGTEHAFVTNIE